MSECKPCQLVECVPANDFSYSLAVPPPPPPGAPPFGNDAFQFCCSGSSTMTFTGTLPSYISLTSQCLVITPNTFRGQDKAVVNGQAQAALQAFINANQANIICSGSVVTVCNVKVCVSSTCA